MMMRIIANGIALCALLAFGATTFAQEDEGGEKPKKEKKKKEKKPREKKPKPQMTDVSLTGKVVAVEKKRKDKTFKVYVLETADGKKTPLPAPRKSKKKDAPAPIKLEDFVDQNVTVLGQGIKRKVKTKDGEKEVVQLRKITSIKAAGEQVAEAGGGDEEE